MDSDPRPHEQQPEQQELQEPEQVNEQEQVQLEQRQQQPEQQEQLPEQQEQQEQPQPEMQQHLREQWQKHQQRHLRKLRQQQEPQQEQQQPEPQQHLREQQQQQPHPWQQQQTQQPYPRPHPQQQQQPPQPQPQPRQSQQMWPKELAESTTRVELHPAPQRPETTVFNKAYLIGHCGILRIIEIIFTFICLVCTAIAASQFSGLEDFLPTGVVGGNAYFLAISVISLILLLAMFMVRLLLLKFDQKKLIIADLLLCTACLVFFLIASITESVFTIVVAQIVADVFGFLNVVALLLNSIFLMKQLKPTS